MDIQTSKIELVKMILGIENNELFSRITEFIKREKDDFWNELNTQEREEILKGIKQLDEGKG